VDRHECRTTLVAQWVGTGGGLRVHGGEVFWATARMGDDSMLEEGSAHLMRATSDGIAEVMPLKTRFRSLLGDYVLEGGSAYYSKRLGVMRTDLADGATRTIYNPGLKSPSFIRFVVSNGYVYGTAVEFLGKDAGLRATFARLPSTGGALDVLATDADWTAPLADREYVYFRANHSCFRVAHGTTKALPIFTWPLSTDAVLAGSEIVFFDWHDIRAVPKAGGVPRLVAQTQCKIVGVAADETHLYWNCADKRGSRIERVALSGGSPSTVIARFGRIADFAVSADRIYWLSDPTASTMRLYSTAK